MVFVFLYALKPVEQQEGSQASCYSLKINIVFSFFRELAIQLISLPTSCQQMKMKVVTMFMIVVADMNKLAMSVLLLVPSRFENFIEIPIS